MSFQGVGENLLEFAQQYSADVIMSRV